MYVPPHFQEQDLASLHSLIAANPFGALVTHGVAGLDANHLPFELDPASGPYGKLIAHVARANPLWQEIASGSDVMVLFSADHAYVSPNWYPSKHELHKQVPTWNYRIVHAHGRITIRDDEKFVRGVVARLTRTHEARSQQERPWKMTDSDPAYIDGLLTAIVGIEIDITKLVGKYKLSQNKEERDRIGAADALGKVGHDDLADAMRKTLDSE